MVRNPTLRHHILPVRHVCIVSECEDARARKLGWEEGLGPRLGRVPGRPGLLAIAGQAVDEDDAVRGSAGGATWGAGATYSTTHSTASVGL